MVSSIKTATYRKVRQAPVHNPVIAGNFPSYQDFRELAVFKFNRFLTSMLALSILVSMVGYSMVVAKENSIITIHNKTNDINFENIDLQNKVDYARSFYNVNDKISKINFLKKADKVLEVKAVATNAAQLLNKEEVKPVSGY